MNISAVGYTREQLETALFSSSRRIRYEYVAINPTGQFLGYLEIDNASISYDSTREVMRTFSGSVKENNLLNLETIDYQIIPYMCLMMFNNKEAKFPLGRFIVSTSKESNNNVNTIQIKGYDLGKIALDDRTSTRFTALSSNTYQYALENLLQNIYPNIQIKGTSIRKSFSQDWDIGTPKITIANDLLKGINYNPLHFTEDGIGVCNPYLLPSEKPIDFQYLANKTSLIVDGMTLASDSFEMPNKWIRYTENPEVSYLMNVFVNDSPDNPFSTVNRKRVIVDSAAVDDIANAAELEAYTKRVASNAMQETFTLTFSTLNMPGHGYREVLWVDIPKYNIADRFVEVAWEMNLTQGGTMSHVCKKVVNLWD